MQSIYQKKDKLLDILIVMKLINLLIIYIFQLIVEENMV